MKKTIRGFNLNDQLVDELRTLAHIRRMSTSALVCQFLEEGVRRALADDSIRQLYEAVRAIKQEG
jgi:predicted DNA-binding ribbon-helix-helix protein